MIQAMHDRLRVQTLPTVEQLDSRVEAIRRGDTALAANLSRQIQVLSREMMILSGQVERLKEDVAEKDMSRVAVLEARLAAAEEQRRSTAEQAAREHEASMQWVRPIFVGVMCSVCVSGVGLLLGFFRAKRMRGSLADLEAKLTNSAA